VSADSDPGDEMPSQRRQSPAPHLQRAAKASLGGAVERYHLDAAIAEALLDVSEELRKIRTLLATKRPT